MSVLLVTMLVNRTATILMEVTLVVVTLATLWTLTDFLALVRSCIYFLLVVYNILCVCTDNNECMSDNTNNCQHICLNTPGSYSCTCNIGFRLNSDNMTCSG